MSAIYSNGGNRWNILGFNFTKRDALSSVYKISMDLGSGWRYVLPQRQWFIQGINFETRIFKMKKRDF